MSTSDASSRPKPGTRKARGAYTAGRARQRDILDGAARVFARSGYRGGSLRDVAVEAGVTHGTIVHHFKTKDELLLALLRDRDKADQESIEGRTTEGDYVGALRGLVEHNAQVPDLIMLMATLQAEAASPDHPAHDYFAERYERIRTYIAEQLEQILPSDLAGRERRIQLGSIHLLGVLDGLQLQWLVDRSIDMAAVFDDYLALMGLREAPN